MVRLLRHRQTKGPDSARPHLNRRATPRLHPACAVCSPFRRSMSAMGMLRQQSCNLSTRLGRNHLLDRNFLASFKSATEERWSQRSINPTISGFQFQAGTRWNPGLSDDKVAEYETVLGVRFPHDFRAFLGAMNGTDLPTLNVYASCGEPPRESVGGYCYPRDLGIVKQRIEDVRESRNEIATDFKGTRL